MKHEEDLKSFTLESCFTSSADSSGGSAERSAPCSETKNILLLSSSEPQTDRKSWELRPKLPPWAWPPSLAPPLLEQVWWILLSDWLRRSGRLQQHVYRSPLSHLSERTTQRSKVTQTKKHEHIFICSCVSDISVPICLLDIIISNIISNIFINQSIQSFTDSSLTMKLIRVC